LTKHGSFAYTAEGGIGEERGGYRALCEMRAKICGEYIEIRFY
jgi:hypothetical protein